MEAKNPATMRAQITIFIVLGLVIVLTVVVLIALASASQQRTPQPQVDETNLSVDTCLQRSVDIAVQGLRDDGVLDADEFGPFDPDQDHYYITAHPNLPFGWNTYYGLCAVLGPNELSASVAPTCPANTYQSSGDTIQEQLRYTVDALMADCGIADGSPEIIVQQNGMIVRWDEPPAQVQVAEPLSSTWAAIQQYVDLHVSSANVVGYIPGSFDEMVLQGCPDCSEVESRNTGQNTVTFSIAGNDITRIRIQPSVPYYLDAGTFVPLDSPSLALSPATCSGPEGTQCTYSFYSFDTDDLTAYGVGSSQWQPSPRRYNLVAQTSCSGTETLNNIRIEDGSQIYSIPTTLTVEATGC